MYLCVNSKVLPTDEDILFLIVIVPTAQAESQNLNDDTRVWVAEDKTVEAECVQWEETPENVVECPPGSVIVTRETTFAEVKQLGTSYFVVITGDAVHDEELLSDLSKRLHRDLNPPQPMLTASCTPTTRTKGGSYLTRPSEPQFNRRVHYEIVYNITSTCLVRDGSDRVRMDGANDHNYRWDSSYWGSNKRGRGISLSGTWSAYEPASVEVGVNSDYTNRSTFDRDCCRRNIAEGYSTLN